MQMFCVCKCIVCLPKEYVHFRRIRGGNNIWLDADRGEEAKVYEVNPLMSKFL